MSATLQQEKLNLRVSQMAENLIGSEIIKLGGEIRDRILQGEKIYNFTIGDFNPQIFPIPAELKQFIIDCYNEDLTNYPASQGELDLRKSVSDYMKTKHDIDYSPEEILIGGGVRPLIYTIFNKSIIR
jgi:aspartate aminotransferase